MHKFRFVAIVGMLFASTAFINLPATKQVKCMVQLINYEGEGAYIIVSVVDKEGKYLKTIRVLGEDPEWYHEIDSWWSYYGKKRYNIDGITGATISGGERSIFKLDIDQAWIGKGNTLRFETAVEEQEYYETDLVVPLDEEQLNAKFEGTGYIRYVRLITSTE